MSLADIKAKIESEAQEQLKAILADTEKQKKALKEDADRQIRELKDTYGERFTKEEPEILKRREIVAGIDAGKVDLGVKQRLIAEAFEGALHILHDLPRDKYLSFVQKLMDEATQTIKIGDVMVSKDEKNLDKSWIDWFNGDRHTELKLSEEHAPITGGFILKSADIDINCSWDMLVRDIRSDIEADVVKQLFS